MLPRVFPAWSWALYFLVGITASEECVAAGIVSTQADIDRLLPCTSITTYVVLGGTLTGTFSLPNLVSAHSIQAESNSTLTNISLPNLISVTISFKIFLPNLTTLDTPSLQSVGENLEINAPSLSTWNGASKFESASHIYIASHNISALELGSIANVSRLEIRFTSPRGSLFLNGTIPRADLKLFGANDTAFTSPLPSLGYMILTGLSSISLAARNCSTLIIQDNPLLQTLVLERMETIGPPEFSYPPSYPHDDLLDPSDVLIFAYNAQLSSVKFPLLGTVAGSMQIMDNPSLNSVGWWMPVSMPDPDVMLVRLNNVTKNIYISGAITSIQFPDLIDEQHSIGGHMNITTTNPAFNCSSLYPFYDLNIMKVLILICVTPTGNYSLQDTYTTPTPTPESTSKTMSKTEMIGGGIGVGIGALIVSTALAFWIIRARGL